MHPEENLIGILCGELKPDGVSRGSGLVKFLIETIFKGRSGHDLINIGQWTNAWITEWDDVTSYGKKRMGWKDLKTVCEFWSTLIENRYYEDVEKWMATGNSAFTGGDGGEGGGGGGGGDTKKKKKKCKVCDKPLENHPGQPGKKKWCPKPDKGTPASQGTPGKQPKPEKGTPAAKLSKREKQLGKKHTDVSKGEYYGVYSIKLTKEEWEAAREKARNMSDDTDVNQVQVCKLFKCGICTKTPEECKYSRPRPRRALRRHLPRRSRRNPRRRRERT